MSGHSKWSKVKHQKATTDVVKGQQFTKASQAISIAVREGGGVADPNSNFKLRLAIDKAKSVNMPKDTIERAIVRGQGGDSGNITEKVYEGFGPSGTALIISAITDNPNRAVSSVKNILDRNGGSLANPGAVTHLFKRAGIFTVLHNSISFDELMSKAIEAGVDDVVDQGDHYSLIAQIQNFASVKASLDNLQVEVEESEFGFIPLAPLSISPDKSDKVNILISQLEDLEDVVSVYTNRA